MRLKKQLVIIESGREKITRKLLLPAEKLGLDQYFKVDNTYKSLAMCGNRLTLTETKILLEDGITAHGKRIQDHFLTSGHAKAFTFMLHAARTCDLYLATDTIKHIDRLINIPLDEYAGEYRRSEHTSGYATHPDDIPGLMERLIDKINDRNTHMHPVKLAAFAYCEMARIMPFENTMPTARLVMNLVLVNRGYSLVTFKKNMEYTFALSAARDTSKPDNKPMIKLVCKREAEAQRDYCRLLRIPLKEKTGHER